MKNLSQIKLTKRIMQEKLDLTKKQLIKSTEDRELDTIELSRKLLAIDSQNNQLEFMISKLTKKDDYSYDIYALKEQLKENLQDLYSDLSSDREYSEKAIIIMKSEVKTIKIILEV